MANATRTMAAPASAVHLLHRAGQRADEMFARNVSNSDLTPRRFAVLQAVGEADGLSQTAIMKATGIDRSSTSALVRRLVMQGWLQRRRTKRDNRVYAVRLTSTGREALAAAEPGARSTDQAVLACLSPTERTRFLEALKRMVATEEG